MTARILYVKCSAESLFIHALEMKIASVGRVRQVVVVCILLWFSLCVV